MRLDKQHIYLLVGLLIFLLGQEPATILVLIGLSVWSLMGVRPALQALTLGILVFFLNKNLYSSGSNITLMLRWVLLFTASGSIFIRAKIINKPILFLLFFCGGVSILSFLYSHVMAVSLFKIITFTIGATAILTGFKNTIHDKGYWESWFYSIFVTIVIYSALLYPTGLGKATYEGYISVTTHFIGAFKHPNAFGVYMGITLCYLLGKVIIERKGSFFDVFIVVLAIVEILLSGTRGAVVNIFLSGLLLLLYSLFKNKTWRSKIGGVFRNKKNLTYFAFALIIVLIGFNRVYDAASKFIVKREVSTLEDAYGFERILRTSRQIENIQEYPFTGIGFGVHTNPEWWLKSGRISYDPIFGLPIGASVEKGFIFVSVVEENGWIGTILLLFFIGALIKLVGRNKDLPSMYLLFSCFMVNISEAIFFSLGGLGLYAWLMIGFSTVNVRSV